MRPRGSSSRAFRRRWNALLSQQRKRHSLPLLLCLLLLALVLGLQLRKDGVAWLPATAAGDNLLPTPWHPSRSTLPWGIGRLRRNAQLLWCSAQCRHQDAAVPAPAKATPASPNPSPCPAFFQWIHHDLAPWQQTGVTQQHVLAAKKFAAFRVVILHGRLYVEHYYRCVQSRALFTIWSLLLLLDRFPGQVPDIDLMFDCMDQPHFSKADPGHGTPALFRYCSSEDRLDIPFPDWTFWGWPETRLKPWPQERDAIFQGAGETPWEDRDPFAYWRGNPHVAPVRGELLLCNQSGFPAHLYVQDWGHEFLTGFKGSSLARQCKHRFMIYSEGHAWSVSYKYAMACGSPLLAIQSQYFEFFTRGLIPARDYLPLERENLCNSIKNLVEAGNEAPAEMKAMAARAHDFLQHDLSMDNVYNYMLHLLTEYSGLLRYQPSVPPLAEPVCLAKLLCQATPLQREFLEQTMPKQGSQPPIRTCAMPAANASYFEEILSGREQLARRWRNAGRNVP